MSDIRLIATDLDGTVIGGTSDFHLYNEFRDKLIAFRKKHNSIWSICTGRGLGSTREFIAPMEVMGIRPDYVIVNHAYIYEYTRFGYIPHILWNIHIRLTLWKNYRLLQRTIDEWYDTITGASFGVITVYKRRNRLRMRFNTEESAIAAEKMMLDGSDHFRHLRVFRQMKEIDVFQLPFTKGLAVSELARHLKLGKEHIMAIGDGYNDISMLDDDSSAYPACPANAQAEVKELVHKNGGHVSRKNSLAGVLDSMDAYLNGTVDSSLPDDWKPPEMKSCNVRGTPSMAPGRNIFSFVLFGIVLYTVLMTVAWFDILPFSRYILIPFQLLVKVIERVFSFFF